MFENPRRGRQARNFTTNAPKILDFKSSSEQIFSRKLSLGAPEQSDEWAYLLRGTQSLVVKDMIETKTFFLEVLGKR